jgi:hypothetical protein
MYGSAYLAMNTLSAGSVRWGWSTLPRVYLRPDSPATVDVVLMVTRFVFADNALRRVRRFRNIDKVRMDVQIELCSRV